MHQLYGCLFYFIFVQREQTKHRNRRNGSFYSKIKLSYTRWAIYNKMKLSYTCWETYNKMKLRKYPFLLCFTRSHFPWIYSLISVKRFMFGDVQLFPFLQNPLTSMWKLLLDSLKKNCLFLHKHPGSGALFFFYLVSLNSIHTPFCSSPEGILGRGATIPCSNLATFYTVFVASQLFFIWVLLESTTWIKWW